MQNLSRDEVAARLWELNLELSPEISYRLETVFSVPDGWFVNRKIRKKYRQLQNLEPLLNEMLLENEQVQLVLQCNQSTFADVFLMGSLWIESTTFTSLVFTNLRLFCIRTDDTGIPRKIFWQVYYSQIRELQRTAVENARICLKDGRKLFCSRLTREELDRMEEVVLENCDLFRRKGFDPPVTQSREQLCGHCFDVIPQGEYECQSCGASYWKPAEVGVRSFVFPSWGDYVMQHDTLAFTELIGYLILLWFTTAAFSEGKYVLGVAVYLIANLADALLSVQIASRALHLKSTPFERADTGDLLRREQTENESLETGPGYAGYRVADAAEQL